MQRRLVCSLVAALAACLLFFGNPSPVSAGVRYTVTDVSAIWREAKGNDPSIDYFSASSINDLGQIAGGYATMDGTYHAFMWDPTTGLHDIGDSTDDLIGYDINNRGQVVGKSTRPDGVTHAFLWDPITGLQDLGSLGGYCYAVSINDNGNVVGDSYMSNGRVHGFLWSADGGMIDLGTFGGDYSWARGINNAGQIVGDATPEVGLARSFLWDAVHGMQDLGTVAEIRAATLNDRGWIVGSVTRSLPTEEFFPPNTLTSVVVWDGETLRDLGSLAGVETLPKRINDHFQIVGNAWVPVDETPRWHAYLWEESTGFQDLNDLVPADSPWVLYSAADINNGGSILAIDVRPHGGGVDAVLLLTPIPEPGMLILLVTLFGAVGVVSCHRGRGGKGH
jgi:probable HAF family extracellular repeat protein